MSQTDSQLYSSRVTASGGRRGTIRSEDDLLELVLALPQSMGGPGGATNPEQLFAGSYAACFENAVLHVAREADTPLDDDDVLVTADIGLDRKPDGTFGLSAALAIAVTGRSLEEAEALVRKADRICPYSNAIRGNVPVVITVTAR